MCLNSHRRGVSLDSADKGQVPLLTQRDEHWGEGDGGQARELLDTKGEGGDGEAGQSVGGLTDGLIETGHVGVHQPVSHQSQLTVTVPGVPMQGHSV